VGHSLTGTILIDLQHKRLANLSGQLITVWNLGMGSWGTSTTAAQSRLGAGRTFTMERLPWSIFNYQNVWCSSRQSANKNKIIGVVANATAHGMKEDAKEEMKAHGMDKHATERGHMTVTDLTMVSDTCQK
jgi:hypothetical protein